MFLDYFTSTRDYCQHCGLMHFGACPRIKSIEYYENGTLKRIEYREESTGWSIQYTEPAKGENNGD